MKKKSNLGFTLIEMMIVTEIIAIVVAIAIPSLIRARIQSNEATAVGNLRMVGTAQVTHNLQTGRFGTLEELCAGDQEIAHLVGVWTNGCVKSQYMYSYEVADIADEIFRITAAPVNVNQTAIRTYWIDETGEINYSMPGGGDPAAG